MPDYRVMMSSDKRDNLECLFNVMEIGPLALMYPTYQIMYQVIWNVFSLRIQGSVDFPL